MKEQMKKIRKRMGTENEREQRIKENRIKEDKVWMWGVRENKKQDMKEQSTKKKRMKENRLMVRKRRRKDN